MKRQHINALTSSSRWTSTGAAPGESRAEADVYREVLGHQIKIRVGALGVEDKMMHMLPGPPLRKTHPD